MSMRVSAVLAQKCYSKDTLIIVLDSEIHIYSYAFRLAFKFSFFQYFFYSIEKTRSCKLKREWISYFQI